MRQRNFRRSFLDLIAIAGLIFLLSLGGCPDDDGNDDDLEVTDLEGRTFNNVDLGVIDSNLEGQTGTLVFGNATNNAVTFTLTIGDDVIEGSARELSSEEFEFTILEINGDPIVGTEFTIDGDPDDVTITVGGSLELNTEISTDGDEQTITVSNPDTGFSQDFVFESPDDMNATGNTGD